MSSKMVPKEAGARLRMPRASGEEGFLMAALLVGMAVTAIWMSTMLPTWRQQAQRQREDDLIFRGEQYARAIALYATKNNGALPTNIDDLVRQRYLRKKWKDPITGKDFMVLGAGSVTQPGQGGGGEGRGGSGQGGTPAPQQGAGIGAAGIRGVYSESTDTPIRVYANAPNAQQYSQWLFDYQSALIKMGRVGAGAPGQGGDGRGGPGAGRGDGSGRQLAPGRGGRSGGATGGRGGARGGDGAVSRPGTTGRGGVAPGRGAGS
jgi:type II secretory pathway pseudopilin PulG